MEVNFNSAGLAIAATILITKTQKGGVLFVGGGGAYTRELYKVWQEYLLEHGHSSLAFDFPGIGDSEGELSGTSLNSRIVDIDNALEYFATQIGVPKQDIVLCGRSMSGPLVIRIASKYKQKKVILLYPAAYSEDAYNKNFGEAFSRVIRAPESWKDSLDFDHARNISGSLCVLYGEFDSVIPKEIQEKYMKIAKEKGSAIVLEGVGHNQFLWEDDEKSIVNRQNLFDVVQLFLDK